MIIISAAASFLLLAMVFFIALPKKVDYGTEKVEKILEFKNANFAGHEQGQKVWEFKVGYGWSGKDKEVTYLTKVQQGQFYKKGDLVIKNLSAPEVKAYRTSKIVEAYGTDKKRIVARVAFTGKDRSGRRRFAIMQSNYLRYEPNLKKTLTSGNITLKERDTYLSGEEMEINHETETADLRKDIKYRRPDVSLSCDTLNYQAKEEQFIAFGRVKSKIKGQKTTFLNADRILLFADQNREVQIVGSVEAFQGKKAIVSNAATYLKPQNQISFLGSVKTVIEKGKLLLKEETAQKLKSKDARELLYSKTFLTSDTLTLSLKSGDAQAVGGVLVSQKGRRAKADQAAYSDQTENITLTGNVYLAKEKQWVKCQKIFISVKQETFEAVGSVEAEFKIKK